MPNPLSSSGVHIPPELLYCPKIQPVVLHTWAQIHGLADANGEVVSMKNCNLCYNTFVWQDMFGGCVFTQPASKLTNCIFVLRAPALRRVTPDVLPDSQAYTFWSGRSAFKVNNMKTGFVYILYFPKLDEYKIGSTVHLRHRMNRLAKDRNCKPELIFSFETPEFRELENWMQVNMTGKQDINGTPDHTTAGTEYYKLSGADLEWLREIAETY